MEKWSNLAFLIPLSVATYFRLYVMVILIFIAMATSIVYHIHGEERFKSADVFISYMLIGANTYLSFLSRFKFPYFPLALLFVAIAFYFYHQGRKRKYSFNHAMWHLSSAVITLICITGYVTY